MHGQASLLSEDASANHLQVEAGQATSTRWQDGDVKASKSVRLARFGCGLAGLMLIGASACVLLIPPAQVEFPSGSTQVSGFFRAYLPARLPVAVGKPGKRGRRIHMAAKRNIRQEKKLRKAERKKSYRVPPLPAIQTVQNEVDADNDEVDHMTFLRQRTQLSDFTFQLDVSAQEEEAGSPFNSTDYFRQRFPPSTLAGVGLKELLHTWERSVRVGEETRRERNRRSHRFLVKSILSVMKKMVGDLPPEEDDTEVPLLPVHRRRRRRRQNGIETVGLISSDAFADDVSVVALASFSRGQLEYSSMTPTVSGPFRSRPQTPEGDAQDALLKVVEAQLGSRAAIKMAMDVVVDGLSNISVLSIEGLVQPELSFRSTRALLDKVAEWAQMEQSLVMVGNNALQLSDGTDLTAYYTGLGFVEMQLSDTSKVLIYMPASETLVVKDDNETSIWSDENGLHHNLRGETLAMEECMRGLHVRRIWSEADLFSPYFGRSDMPPGTPDGMFQERDGSLTCVQVVRIPVPLCKGSACTFVEQEDAIYEAVLNKIQKSQAWMEASGITPLKFVIFCWCQGWPDNGVSDRALYLVDRMRKERWPFLLRFMVPSEPGAIFPHLFGSPDDRFIPVRGLFMARLRP